MFAIAKIKFGLNLLAVAPLVIGIAIVGTIPTVQAQTINNNTEESTQLPDKVAHFSAGNTSIPAEAFLDASQHQTTFPGGDNFSAAATPQPSSKTLAANPEELASNYPVTPFPGTTATNANILSQPSVVEPSVGQNNAPEVAQLPVDPGRRTRGGSSYVGVGANIGLSGDTALGDGNFMIISKIGLTRSLALRPGVVLGDDAIFLLPLTYEFSIRRAEALEEVLRIAPYIGGGVTIATGDDDDIGVLLTGGIDVPLSSQFTANAALNVGIADETDVGLSVGVGYNFGGFGL